VILNFNRLARGPAWERWLILEDQLGDTAFAGEVIITYTDESVYAEVECVVLFRRDLADEEAEELLNAVSSILSGRGNVTIFTTQEIVSRGFSMLEEDEEVDQD